MKKAYVIAILAILTVIGCTTERPQPLEVAGKFVVPSDHPFVLPPGGIRFTNGATIGVQPD